ncbi:MAG: c-type cytochrome [bacterium]
MKNGHTFLALLGFVCAVAGCSEDPSQGSPAAPGTSVAVTTDLGSTESVESPDTLTVRQMQMWAASCAQCHVDGNAGAPIVGIAEHWQPRLAQGMETLLRHTLEGLNSMPPLGYCMACEQDDFRAMIDFMSKDHRMRNDVSLVEVSR